MFEANHIGAEAARIAMEKGAKLVVLPTVPFGVNTGPADIRLDLPKPSCVMTRALQARSLGDIIEVLNRQGIFKLNI